ncbi:glycosyltransferase family 2 protein [Zunongwangia pacifica]|uniref:Glycosyltransferase n=1 Tax=Zunongwangia pacifica TaxID=2911062 RepID=A0A9X1ZQK5_9FLAO|nr:glycosyltransferase family 2 protein [Zunongwangia pacifica]MCL6219177.1 glycosyltransferase [Zunongwangia pacifica]
MLVSIIIPVHKLTNYLHECVLSAINQSYQFLEILIACNGELSIQECRNFLGIRDKRIYYLKTKLGRHNARNEALIKSRGDFIQFLDYDDYLYPNKLEHQIEIAKKYNLSLVISKWKKFNKDIREFYSFPYKIFFDNKVIDGDELIRRLAIEGGYLSTSSWLVSKQLLKNKKWIDSPNDDAVFFFSFLEKRISLYMDNNLLSAYRIHTFNTSSIKTKKDLLLLLKSWNLIEFYLKDMSSNYLNLFLFKAYLNLLLYSREITYFKFPLIFKRLIVKWILCENKLDLMKYGVSKI